MQKIVLLLMLLAKSSCAQVDTTKQAQSTSKTSSKHNYGGWYCPDNLNGFPAVNLTEWSKVPVINGRLPTKEETQTEASLIYIDTMEHPNAKPLEAAMPKLAKYYNEHTKKEELVIIIQALEIGSDSIVGFRYLNGGNGSARYNEVSFCDPEMIDHLTLKKFVTIDVKITGALQDSVWEVITNPIYLNRLYPDEEIQRQITPFVADNSVVNYVYAPVSNLYSSYGDKPYGNFYIQRDYLLNNESYVEKFLLLENQFENYTELQITCGPYSLEEYEQQKAVLEKWVQALQAIVSSS